MYMYMVDRQSEFLLDLDDCSQAKLTWKKYCILRMCLGLINCRISCLVLTCDWWQNYFLYWNRNYFSSRSNASFHADTSYDTMMRNYLSWLKLGNGVGVENIFVGKRRCSLSLPWWQGSWGQHGAHLGPFGPRLAPYMPLESCYLGRLVTTLIPVCRHLHHRFPAGHLPPITLP